MATRRSVAWQVFVSLSSCRSHVFFSFLTNFIYLARECVSSKLHKLTACSGKVWFRSVSCSHIWSKMMITIMIVAWMWDMNEEWEKKKLITCRAQGSSWMSFTRTCSIHVHDRHGIRVSNAISSRKLININFEANARLHMTYMPTLWLIMITILQSSAKSHISHSFFTRTHITAAGTRNSLIFRWTRH